MKFSSMIYFFCHLHRYKILLPLYTTSKNIDEQFLLFLSCEAFKIWCTLLHTLHILIQTSHIFTIQ